MKKNKFNIKKYIEKIKSLTKKLNSFIVNNKLLFSFIIVFLLCILILFISNSFAVEVPVETISFTSEDLNFEDGEEGAWKVTKSAKWLSKNKARVTYELSANPSSNEVYTDYILVVDGSLNEHDANFSSALKTMLTNMFDDGKNRVALIGFNNTASLITDFSYDDTSLNVALDSFLTESRTAKKEISYYSAFSELEVFMNNYEAENASYVKAVFVTDGKPVIDSPKEVSLYQSLKENYQELSFLAIQYEMGDEVVDSVKNISDEQIVTNKDNVWKILPNIYFGYDYYETFLLSDYFKEPFTVSKVAATNGSASILGDYSIEWNLLDNSSFGAGGTASLTVDLNVSDNYVKGDVIAVTDSTIVDYNYNGTAETFTTNDTPTLATAFNVTYDGNAPDSCTVTNVPSSSLVGVYDIVKPSSVVPKCTGYQFKGWKVITADVDTNSDGSFTMPYKAVTLKAIWSKMGLKKSMDGKVYDGTTLYKVMEEAADLGDYASEYTGEHQDSIDGTGTEKIYYYDASVGGDAILDENNVVFAGMCWQMIRTTDTGGVKLLYNGEVDSDGACGTNRYTHSGYTGSYVEDVTGNYYYSDDYIYNASEQSFTLTGNTFQADWINGNYEQMLGKYSCMSESLNSDCQNLYYIDQYVDEFSAYIYDIDGYELYSTLGDVPFNRYSNSPAYVGYMYNDVYEALTKPAEYNEILKSSTLSTSYWYADEVTWDSTNKKYTLKNPYKVTSTSSYKNLTKKYTFNSTSSTTTSSTVRYIVGVSSSTYYYQDFSSGQTIPNLLDRRYYDSTYTINSSGFYVLPNAQQFLLSNWYSDYNLINKKYISVLNPDQDIEYVLSSSRFGYYYNSTIDTNFLYSSGFTYANGEYTLSGTPVTFWEWTTNNINSLKTAHYSCFSLQGRCDSVKYVYQFYNDKLYYIVLNNGESVEDAISKMLNSDTVNKKNSTIKTAIDIWYKKYLSDYTSYLEDTVFCNNRYIDLLNGWDSNGQTITASLTFENYNVDNGLICNNVTDRFAVSNPKAKLDYPVGLLTSVEARLFTNDSLETPSDFYLMTPAQFYTSNESIASNLYYDSRGGVNIDSNTVSKGVRPVISLKPGTTYVSGDGSMTNPYVVDTSK